MIAKKYGKVIILALINVFGVCLVYNNVTTDNGDIAKEHVVEQRDVINADYATKDVDRTKLYPKNSDNNIPIKAVPDIISYPKSDLTSYPSSDHEKVQSMKNLLSIKINTSNKKEQPQSSSERIEDEELKKKLLDNSEIDLYPPYPVIMSSSSKLEDQVKKFNSPTKPKWIF